MSLPSHNSRMAATIVEVPLSDVQVLMTEFRAPGKTNKQMQEYTHALTRHVVSASQKHCGNKLPGATLIPILRGGLPMYLGAQAELESSTCVLVRCSKMKGTGKVEVDWMGRRPYPREADETGPVIVLDTIIATGDTIYHLCDELWEMNGHTPNSVVLMACYAAPDALKKLALHPVIDHIAVACLADAVDDAGYLIPYTNGDIGDKIYGNKDQNEKTSKLTPKLATGQPVDSLLSSVEELLQSAEGGKGWALTIGGAGLEKHVQFKTFKKTMDFWSEVATEAAREKHHPEWTNTYNKVSILWTTHNPEGLTQQDVNMARITDELIKKYDGQVQNL